jgi:tetratricopeptide (TPR) repeat protein
MKKITTLFLTLLTLTVFGQTETETIKKANDLIANKKYESAFKLLDDFDPKNSKPDIVLLKENIVLNYFVSSIMHQMFALKDLEKNEDIMVYRGKEGSFGMQMFQVDSILENLIKLYPTNCKLYKGLGEFYYEAHLKYGGKWLKDDNELFKLMETDFQKAVDGNCADYLSYYVLGYINLAQEKYKASIPYFLKSIELHKDYASSHYNLAYAYLYTDDRQNALKYAKNSLDLYTDQTYKSDAARMLGQIYTELKDDKNALENYELADKIDTGNYYNIKPLLNLYVKTNNKKAEETAKAFFNLAPANPTIYNDLEEIYYSNKKENDLTAFYKSQLSSFKDNNKVLGNLNFYLGKIYIDTDKKVAKEYFLKAKDIFSKIYDKDHQVFKAIDEGLKQCEK